MVEKIVYFLGAGFSAPLGLPVMSNFLVKSKDMFFEDPVKYSHFQDIFREIQALSVIKNYYESDLFNIEEILSILYMHSQLENSELKKDFIRYLKDVISYFTPSLVPYKGFQLASNWHGFIFGPPKDVYNKVGAFAANLLNLTIKEISRRADTKERFRASRFEETDAKYAVVTVNYDRVLEQVPEYLTSNISTLYEKPIGFVSPGGPKEPTWEEPAIVKLHGDVTHTTIVPPTWSKGVNSDIIVAWQAAHSLLREATQIRIIGYSLPVSDAYVQYLLKSAVSDSQHLKSLDVLCLDPDGSVEKRYRDFITFRYFRFKSVKVEDYLAPLSPDVHDSHKILFFNKLEKEHEMFMTDVSAT